jgi:hypothetical protein
VAKHRLAVAFHVLDGCPALGTFVGLLAPWEILTEQARN